MLRRRHISVRIILLIALCCLAAFGEDRYLVKVTGDINGLANRLGLTVVKSLTGSALGTHVLSSRGALPQTVLRNLSLDRKSTRLNSSHVSQSRMPSSA